MGDLKKLAAVLVLLVLGSWPLGKSSLELFFSSAKGGALGPAEIFITHHSLLRK